MNTQTSVLLQKLEFLDMLQSGGRALDLGASSGTDTFRLLGLGYEVDAVEIRKENVEKMFERQVAVDNQKLRIFLQDMTEFPVAMDTYNVVIASNSLPFVTPPRKVWSMLDRMVKGTKSGGIIAFSIFGPHDEWKDRDDMTFFDYEYVEAILQTYPVEVFFKLTEEGKGKITTGAFKWWHIHRFCCFKK
jgi:SAM-dependent methyltransferase